MRSATGGSTPPKFAPGGLAAPTPLLTSPTSLPSVRTPYEQFVAYGRSKTANILVFEVCTLFNPSYNDLAGRNGSRHCRDATEG
jgi:hypothetical protein